MASMVSSSLISLTVLFLTIRSSEAKTFLVGGSATAWKVPSSPAESLNKWAEATRFQVGDSLVWKFDGAKDSVLQVTREAYLSCNTSSPIKEHKDGDTKVGLHRAGAFYFISGAKGACQEGEKLIVVVLSPMHRGFSPAPAPAPYDGTAVAPVTGGAEMAGRGMVGALAVLGLVLGMMVL